MGKKYQIFISSTYEDLKEERRKVQDIILSMQQFPVGMEMFSAADEDQWEIIRETIDSSDYYILIIGHKYGSVIEKGDYVGISYTQKEFRYALERKIPVLAFLIDDTVAVTPDKMERDMEKENKLKLFIKEVMNDRMVQWWTSKDDLANKVSLALTREINRGRRPGWVRADGHRKIDEKETGISHIINIMQNNNILEYEIFIRYTKDVQDYRLKFTNKYTKYMDKYLLNIRQYMLEKGMDQSEFYSKYYDDFIYEWVYIGDSLEKFCTKLNVDFSQISKRKKKINRNNTIYKRYEIDDAWHVLEKINDDRRFVYGAYVLSKLLHGEKQRILKEDFNRLIYELISQNHFIEFEGSAN